MTQRLQMSLIPKYASFYLRGFCEYHFRKHFGTLAPRELMFPVTYRCNARCVMCNIWKLPERKELSLEQIKQVLSDELFRGIQVVNLTGGEPTLRNDLAQIVHILIDSLPELKKVTLTTNALNTKKVVGNCIDIAEASNEQGIDFLVEASLDGIGEAHDKIRNVPDAFSRVKKTILKIEQLSGRHQFRLGINTVISPINLQEAPNIYEWCKEHNINTFFTIASLAENYFSNIGEAHLKFDGQDKKYLVEFLCKLTKEKSPLNFLAYYYYDLIKMIRNGQPRTTPCVFAVDAFILDPYGDMYYCMHGQKLGNTLDKSCGDIYFHPKNLAHRTEIIKKKCPTCFINCFSSIGLGKELIKYFKFLSSRT